MATRWGTHCAVVAALSICASASTVVLAQDATALIERREAAAGFVHPQAMLLGVLRRECRDLLPPDDGVDRVAEAWWQRNRDMLDASVWVVGQAVTRYRAEGAAAQASARERVMLEAFANTMLTMVRVSFGRQLPTEQACRQALAPFRQPELDLQQADRMAGPLHAQRQAFARTLADVRADDRFRPMEDKFRRFDAQVPLAATAIVTHDAIEAAQSRSDSATVVRGYERLAAQGDARAAQSLGLLYWTGRHVEKSPATAVGWFYNAWALGDAEGLNALGVAWRDGIAGETEPALALVAFAAAMKSPRVTAEGWQRAATNLERLIGRLPRPIVEEAACIRTSTLLERARSFAAKANGVVLVVGPAAPPRHADQPVMEAQFSGASRPTCQF